MSELKFSTLSLPTALRDNLATLGYTEMTPIQAQSLPLVLAGRDVIGKAKTGSGKTAAFGLGVLNNVDVKKYRVQALVLCPTRELADQVAKELRKLARSTHNLKILTLCGGTPFGPQVGSLEHGAHVIVGTPGRVEEHLRKNNLNLDHLNTFVLDEADRMLDSGFQDSLDTILAYVPEPRQTLLFSATYPPEIEQIADRIMQSPATVEVAEQHQQTAIEQVFYEVSDDASRMQALQLLLLSHRPQSTLVFCNTKIETVAVAQALKQAGFSVLALHGDLDQKERDQALVRFSNKSVSICVATDVAARGLDIDDLDAVINYNLARELAVHTHRVGRTGRAGKSGLACTLVSAKEQFKLEKLKKLLLGQDYDSDADNADAFALQTLPDESLLRQPVFKADMVTLQIDGGKKQKVRPGDILGALTGKNGIPGSEVGKIAIFDFTAFVAVSRKVANEAFEKLSNGKLKGRSFRVRRV